MTVVPLRPREFYAVTPGGIPPGGQEPEPAYYERGLDGLLSAIEHAKLLSAGGSVQDVTLTEGRKTKVIMRFRAGGEITGKLVPLAPVPRPDPAALRPGSPKGHIPELCTHAKARAEPQRKRRRNPNLPRPQWPGVI